MRGPVAEPVTAPLLIFPEAHRATPASNTDGGFFSTHLVALPARGQQQEITKYREQSQVVYITKTGKKYHRDGCSYLRPSKIEIRLKDAKSRGYTPCSRCNSPRSLRSNDQPIL